MRRKYGLLALPMFFALNVFSQTNKLGSIEILNFQYFYNPKVSFFFEGQVRSDKMYQAFNYDELKVGIGYNPNNKISLAIGNGFHDTYSPGGSFKKPTLNHEYRLWEQLVFFNVIGRLKLEHRYRVEQRWLTVGFKNRFRYRLNAVITMNKPKVEKGTLYTYINDEVYLTNEAPYFQRNRFYTGLGYRFIKQLTAQVGFVHQFDYLNTKKSSKNYLQTTLLLTMHSHRSIREAHPASMD